MSSLVNLNPPDMSDLDSLQRVSFSIIDASGVSIALIWIRFEDEEDEEVIWDGIQFSEPYDENSTLLKPLGNDNNLYFELIPEGGWKANISELRVEAIPTIV